jgi:hypothetical protein
VSDDSGTRNRLMTVAGPASVDDITAAAMRVEDELEQRDRDKAVDDMRRDSKWVVRLAGAALSLTTILGGFGWQRYDSAMDRLARIEIELALAKQRLEYTERLIAPTPYRSEP